MSKGKESKFKNYDNVEDSTSRLDDYHHKNKPKLFYTKFRNGVKLSKKQLDRPGTGEILSRSFGLRGVQFGNWVGVEDRMNYLYALNVCLYDLNKVLKFPGNNVGINESMAVAFGARGHGSALAHFEPYSRFINLTRYKDSNSVAKEAERQGYVLKNMSTKERLEFQKNYKIKRFLESGGVGAFAHEYGHFLDYYFGQFAEPHEKYLPLTGDSNSVSTKLVYQDEKETERNQLRKQADRILFKINFRDEEGKIKTKYRLRLQDNTENSYYFERVEIFARAFEQYIMYKLSQIGVRNNFLNQVKYDWWAYMREPDLIRVVPEFDKLLVGMRNYL